MGSPIRAWHNAYATLVATTLFMVVRSFFRPSHRRILDHLGFHRLAKSALRRRLRMGHGTGYQGLGRVERSAEIACQTLSSAWLAWTKQRRQSVDRAMSRTAVM